MKKLILLFLVACLAISNGIAQNETTWKENMRLEYYHGGGMRNTSEKISITKDSVNYFRVDEGLETDKKFRFSQEELDKILQVMKDNKFPTIQQTETGFTYDKASTSISFCVGTQCVSKGETSSSELNDDNQVRFSNVEKYILEEVHKKVQSRMKVKKIKSKKK